MNFLTNIRHTRLKQSEKGAIAHEHAPHAHLERIDYMITAGTGRNEWRKQWQDTGGGDTAGS